jgi:hypothetical protein
VVLADSRRPSRNRRYSGVRPEADCLSCTGPLPSAARRSSTLPLDISFVTRARGLVPPDAVPTTPTWQRHQAVPPGRFRLFPFRSPLLGESQLLSFPRVTEMFQFTRFPPLALCVQTRVTPHDGCRVSPFGYPRIEAWSAAPRGFSQPPTSFFGFRRQGIHRWLFVAWRTKDARARSEILKERRRSGAKGTLPRRNRRSVAEGDTSQFGAPEAPKGASEDAP